MKKTSLILIFLTLVLSLCACGAQDAVSVPRHEDPLGEYEMLLAAKNSDAIRTLIDDLVYCGDLESAGEIVSLEFKQNRKYEFTLMCNMFFGGEQYVDCDVWTSQYISTYDRYKRATAYTLDDRLKLLSDYAVILRKFYPETSSALECAMSGAILLENDAEGSLMKSCGSAPAGKVLICYSQLSSEENVWDIYLSPMAALPEELIPSSLAEVEYIIYIDYDYAIVGQYTNGGDAKRIDVTISVRSLPGGESVFTYPVLLGSAPPITISVPTSSSVGASGDPPELSERVKTLAQAFSNIACIQSGK